MIRKIVVLILLLMGSVLPMQSCRDENSVMVVNSLYQRWVREITDENGVVFTAQLSLKGDQVYEFTLLSNAPGHSDGSGRFTVTGNFFTIIDDDQCGSNGVYEFVLGTNSLALIAFDDDCQLRITALQGVWYK